MQKRLEDVDQTNVTFPYLVQGTARILGEVGLATADVYLSTTEGRYWLTVEAYGTVYRLCWDNCADMWQVFQHDVTQRFDGEGLVKLDQSRCALYAELWKAVENLVERVAHDAIHRSVLGTYVEVRDVPATY